MLKKSRTGEKRGISERLKQALITSVEVLQESRQAQATKAAAFVTVGNDGSCTYHSGTHPIQDAIDAGNSSEIRIANDRSYTENLTINDRSITLKGGYANCAAAYNDIQTGRTEISGAAGTQVITIMGNSARHDIVLDSLWLKDGSSFILFGGGGILAIAADALIRIKNTWISDNDGGGKGGGIAVLGDNADFSLTDTVIYHNTADAGGGIYCDGTNNSISLFGNSGVSFNTANGTSGTDAGKGGGIFITNGCKFLSYSGTTVPWWDFKGISGNNATGQGGGVYADHGATVTLYGGQLCYYFGCLGDTSNPANLDHNRAQSDNTGATDYKAGSGAFISGANTQMFIYDGRVTGNTIGDSDYHGGAIYVDAGATFTTARVGKKCWNQAHCNYYANNAAGSSGGHGGAFYNDDSTLNITNTVITGNRADWGTVLYAKGAGAKTTIKASLIYGNGDDGADGFNDWGVFRVRDDAELDIERSTIADNKADIVFRILSSADAGTSSIFASIVHDASSGDVYQSSPGSVSNDCTLFHESNSIPSLSTNSFVDNPQFVDRSNANYHLKLISPAIDFCDSYPPVDYSDMDFEAYGFDYPTVSNNHGPYDIGADEVYNTIFADSFE